MKNFLTKRNFFIFASTILTLSLSSCAISDNTQSRTAQNSSNLNAKTTTLTIDNHVAKNKVYNPTLKYENIHLDYDEARSILRFFFLHYDLGSSKAKTSFKQTYNFFSQPTTNDKQLVNDFFKTYGNFLNLIGIDLDKSYGIFEYSYIENRMALACTETNFFDQFHVSDRVTYKNICVSFQTPALYLNLLSEELVKQPAFSSYTANEIKANLIMQSVIAANNKNNQLIAKIKKQDYTVGYEKVNGKLNTYPTFPSGFFNSASNIKLIAEAIAQAKDNYRTNYYYKNLPILKQLSN